MEATEEIQEIRDNHTALSVKKRRCPHCSSYLFLERVYGEGFWWSCLICGWEQPAGRSEGR